MADSPDRSTRVQRGQCKCLALLTQFDCSWWTTLCVLLTLVSTESGSLHWSLNEQVRQSVKRYEMYIQLWLKVLPALLRHYFWSPGVKEHLRQWQNTSRWQANCDKANKKKTLLNAIRKMMTPLCLWEKTCLTRNDLEDSSGCHWNLPSRWRLVMPFSVSVASMVEMEEGNM